MSFLKKIAEEKQAELAAKKRNRPEEALRDAIDNADIRDFHAAISPGAGEEVDVEGANDADEGVRIIAELKARTPSVESFTQSQSLFDVALTYEENGAAAVSVVTDAHYFGTSLDDATDIRNSILLPVLVKDFVVDPYQITEARAHGADAILLIARLLGDGRLAEFIDRAAALGMTALVEAHDEEELHAALHAGATVIGVNNRNLDTLAVSLETTRRLAPLVPRGVPLVAESGVRTRRDVEHLAALGADAILVGGALLDSADPGLKLRELRGHSREPRDAVEENDDARRTRRRKVEE